MQLDCMNPALKRLGAESPSAVMVGLVDKDVLAIYWSDAGRMNTMGFGLIAIQSDSGQAATIKPDTC
jgi:hypothetical protein